MLLLIVISLATHQVVNVIRNSALLMSYRSWIDMGCLPTYYLPAWLRSHLQAIQACPWCMSINVALLLALLSLLPGVEVLLYGLAASQLANFLHEVFNHQGPRRPRGELNI